MPFKMRNRFLVLGLTGPLGSGCTTTAKFLSGQEFNGKTLEGFLKDLTGNGFFEGLDSRITKTYKLINQLKDKISDRTNKSLGPYKNEMIDFSSDLFIKKRERELKYAHHSLQIYLRKREVSLVLKKFLEEPIFQYELNLIEKALFGFGPFAYISFSNIILKLVVEAFCSNSSGKANYDSYFDYKLKTIISEEHDLKKAFIDLKKDFEKNFNNIEEKWNEYSASNKFIKDKMYVVNIDNIKLALSVKAVNGIKKFVKENTTSYYEYLLLISNLLGKIKGVPFRRVLY